MPTSHTFNGLSTVKTHLIHIFDKTGVDNRASLRRADDATF
jgi:ATP/maltotriose-dependent transcriptional regulator MalT